MDSRTYRPKMSATPANRGLRTSIDSFSSYFRVQGGVINRGHGRGGELVGPGEPNCQVGAYVMGVCACLAARLSCMNHFRVRVHVVPGLRACFVLYPGMRV